MSGRQAAWLHMPRPGCKPVHYWHLSKCSVIITIVISMVLNKHNGNTYHLGNARLIMYQSLNLRKDRHLVA